MRIAWAVEMEEGKECNLLVLPSEKIKQTNKNPKKEAKAKQNPQQQTNTTKHQTYFWL